MDTAVIIQPKGILKILQIVFSIIAFATLTSYTGQLNFNVECNKITTATSTTTNPETTTSTTTTPETTTSTTTTPETTTSTTPETTTSTTPETTTTTTPETTTTATPETITTTTPETTTTTTPETTTSTTTTLETTTTTPETTTTEKSKLRRIESKKERRIYAELGEQEKTTTSASASTTTVADSGKDISILVDITYPFRLDEVKIIEENCEGENATFILKDTTSSKSVFFVFTAVTSFLFALVMVPIYLFQDSFLKDGTMFNLLDLGIHGILALFWFAGSIAWAAGLTDLQLSLDGDNNFPAQNKEEFGCSSYNCEIIPPGDYGNLITSVVFGFFNIILYGGNIWYTYKQATSSS